MRYILEIVIDERAKEASCFILEDSNNEGLFKVVVRTPSNKKLDFKTMTITTINPDALDVIMGNSTLEEIDEMSKSIFSAIVNMFYNDSEKVDARIILDAFINSFAYGKDVISNSVFKTIRVNESDEEKDVIDDNNKIYNFLKINKSLLNSDVIVNGGLYDFTLEDYEKVKMFDDTNIRFIMQNRVDSYTAKGLGIAVKLINKIVNDVNREDLSEIEKAMYAYDLLRINYAKSIENNSREELEINELVDSFNEPSDFYASIYAEILDRLGIRTLTASGEFYPDEDRKFTVCYIDDDKYDIEGVYYFDIGINSVQSVKNSLAGSLDEKNNNPILDALTTYSGFARTKVDMECSGFLNYDHVFADFDESYVDVLGDLESEKIKRVLPQLMGIVNNISNFIDDKVLIKEAKDFSDEEKIDDITEKIEEYVNLFDNTIYAEDFLEILFNVRKAEYKHNKEVFKLSLNLLKDIIYNSNISFQKTTVDEEDMGKIDLETLMKEDIENNFEDFAIKNDLDKQIKKLKLTICKEEEFKKEDKEK